MWITSVYASKEMSLLQQTENDTMCFYSNFRYDNSVTLDDWHKTIPASIRSFQHNEFNVVRYHAT